MYFNTKQATVRSIIVLIFIFVVGLTILDSVFVSTPPTVGSISIFYYNSSRDISVEGESQCDINAVSPVSRISVLSATTTEMRINDVLSQLFFTPLNLIEEQSGFTKKNMPTDIEISNILVMDSSATVTLNLNEDSQLNDCEDKLFRWQISQTLERIPEISTSTLTLTYTKF